MAIASIEEIRAAHKVIAEFPYELHKVERGYANRTLYVNVGTKEIKSKPVTQEMKDIFTGGKGFDLWLMWNGIKDDTKWDDPENELVLSAGPIAGITAYPGTGKVTATTISPLTHSVMDSNGGAHFGPFLKFAGWDALEIQGKSDKEVIIYIDGDEGVVRIEEAPLDPFDTHLIADILTEMYSKDEKDKKSISVISAGEAAKHLPLSSLNFSYWHYCVKQVHVLKKRSLSLIHRKMICAVPVRLTWSRS